MILKILGIAVLCAAGLFILICAACFAVSWKIVGSVFGRYKREPANAYTERSRWGLYSNANAAGRKYVYSLGTAEMLTIQSRDGLTLRALYIPAETPSKRVCLAFHGHHSTGLRNMAMFVKYYHEHGFELIIPDLRAHGESDGKWLGFGYLDRLDVADWAKKAAELFPESDILLHGVSMGGASVVCASGTGELPAQVKGIVEDCGFSSSYDQFRNTLAVRTKLPEFPFIPVLSLAMRLRLGYSLADAEPKRFMKRAEVPFLIIHGDADDYVDTAMALDFARACPTEYRLLIVEGAYHASSYPKDQDRYERALDTFWAEISEK